MMFNRKPKTGFSRTEIINTIEDYYESQLQKYLESTEDSERLQIKGILMGYKSSLTLLRAGNL